MSILHFKSRLRENMRTYILLILLCTHDGLFYGDRLLVSILAIVGVIADRIDEL